MKNIGLEKAIEYFGGVKPMATKLGLHFQNVYRWRHSGIPPKHCKSIEDATGGKVTRLELRPDLFA